MNDGENVALLDLLIKQATEGLDDAEKTELRKIESESDSAEIPDFEITAAAIGLLNINAAEQMPAYLHSRIQADSEKFFAASEKAASVERDHRYTSSPPSGAGRRSFFDWMGWAVAAAACIVLLANLWLTRVSNSPADRVQNQPVIVTPDESTPERQRQKLIETAPDVLVASVGAGNVANLKDISGDIVWSDSKQAGYMRFRGLPVNDKSKETYQLWIFDETQDPKTPIDGGTFDIDQNGEAVIPINAVLKARNPKMFAVTVEKPGGVVVSNRAKIVALAKTQAS
ncbi:MAG: anti-sigma factor [Acidobacteriota bacterium]